MKAKAIAVAAVLALILAIIAVLGVKNLRELRQRQVNTPIPSNEYSQSTPLPSVSPSDKKALEKLSDVKVAVLYQSVTDNTESRDIGEVVGLLKETKADFIFRGFWGWRPVSESKQSAPEEVLKVGGTEQDIERTLDGNYTYKDLRASITAIKRDMPEAIFVGAIPGYVISKKEKNPKTGEFLDENKTWQMAIDPEKWGLNMTKDEFQEKLSEKRTWYRSFAYFPDITNPDFQELMLSWAERQIDEGADAIWIDGLYSQATLVNTIIKNPNHPAVKDAHLAASGIVDRIHDYGDSKGKYIYVGSWSSGIADLPYPAPNLDFITVTPTSEEVSNKKLDEDAWDKKIATLKDKTGDTPIFAYLDFGTDILPTAIFSQKLSIQEQKEMLKYLDNFFGEKGVKFIYPLHGGFMGDKATKLSFGKYRLYDSLAPEFDTYDTIKDLANKKAE